MTERKEITEKHGVIFILYNKNKIQLEKRTQPDSTFYGYVIIPGGGIESGESPDEALNREVGEEYGVKVLVGESLGIIKAVDSDGIPNIRHVFLVSKWEGNLSNPELKNEHLEANIKQARELCKHPIFQKILDLLESRLSR